jgi:DNA-binding NarL/FixJ family response regulator
VVVLSSDDSDEGLFEAIRLGANGFLSRHTAFASLLAALRGLRQGELALSRPMARRLIEAYRRTSAADANSYWVGGLTSREQQILRLIGAGLCNGEIAHQLFIAENTVKVHVHNLLDKLGASNRSQAATFARQYGLDKLLPVDAPD